MGILRRIGFAVILLPRYFTEREGTDPCSDPRVGERCCPVPFLVVFLWSVAGSLREENCEVAALFCLWIGQ